MQVLIQQSQLMSIEMLNLLNNNDTSGMSNFDLEEIGKKCLVNFKGVYPSDSFPKIKKNEIYFSVIFNLSPHNKPGTHFVAFVKKQNKFYYFDSFGEPCLVDSLKKSISSFTNEIIYSSKKLQQERSIFCSFFCLAFILHMQKNDSTTLTSFLNIFPCKINKNDIFIKNFVKNEISNFVCTRLK